MRIVIAVMVLETQAARCQNSTPWNPTLTNDTSHTASVMVSVGPPGATNEGAGFRLKTGPTNLWFQSGTVTVPGSNSVYVIFNCITGFAVPPPQIIQVGTSNAPVTFSYLPPPPTLPDLLIQAQGKSDTVTLSNVLPDYTFQIEYSTNLDDPGSWWPLTADPTLIPHDALPDFYVPFPDMITETNRFYRAVWVTCPPQ